MSYINRALKKAQQEREARFGNFPNAVLSEPTRKSSANKKWVIAGLCVSALLIAGYLSLGVRYSGYRIFTRGTQSSGTGDAISTGPSSSDGKRVDGGMQEERKAGQEISREKKAAPVPFAASIVNKQVIVNGSDKSGKGKTAADSEKTYKKALEFQKRGNLTEADELYKTVLRVDPRHFRAMNNLGVVYLMRKNDSQAFKQFKRAIAAKRDFVDPYYNLACLHSRVGNIKVCIYYLKQAIAIDRDAMKWAKEDEDMRNVRETPEFMKLKYERNK
jgi:tetratricopeptide (TPR) repeat protein